MTYNDNSNGNGNGNGTLKNDSEEKSTFLKAVELVVADPKKIKDEAKSLMEKYKTQNPNKSDKEIRDKVVEKIISNYSYYSAFSGGATALSSIVPGLGTAIAMVGGGSADAVITIKFQIEMTMALATVYGHNILNEESKRLCFMIAGLGAISEVAKEGGKQLGSKAFISMTNQYLKGATLTTLKEIFKLVGGTFTKSALTKAIPFGVGVVIGFSANKGFTWYVGSKAKDYFESEMDNGDIDITTNNQER